ncbi:MAG TPA: hypothetical protein VE505_18405 [Vicinamibacterales bacterium]|nr:hypothetical protein [Vicinamibacterales bacterium]
MSLSPTPDLFSVVGFLSQHPWIALAIGVALGLAVPSSVRRNALRLTRWAVLGALWVAVGLWSLPLLVVMAALNGLGGMKFDTPVPPAVGPWNVWEQVLAQIEREVESHAFFAFFRETVFVSDVENVIRVRVQTPKAGEWIVSQCVAPIKEALAVIGRADSGVEFVSGEFHIRAI